jgi:hypothetical protein
MAVRITATEIIAVTTQIITQVTIITVGSTILSPRIHHRWKVVIRILMSPLLHPQEEFLGRLRPNAILLDQWPHQSPVPYSW